jgi:hypothetical protein
MSELTTKLGLSKPADDDTSWGDEIRGALDIIDKALISHYFGENAAGHSGLNFAYLGGVYRNDATIATIAAGSIELADNITNYIFLDVSVGAIATNATGFESGDIPLFTVITAAGAITNVTDNRTLMAANVTLVHNHDTTKSDVGLGNVDNVKQMPISGGVLEDYAEKIVALLSSEGASTIDLSAGNVFEHTLTEATTYTISNAVSGSAHSFTLIITQPETAVAVTFPASVKWQNGATPDISTGSKIYVVPFLSIDGGTTWLGMFGGAF